MISLILALLLLATPAAADHAGTSGGSSGSHAPGSTPVHCQNEGTTKEGQLCAADADCTGTCTDGWCYTDGDSLPCTVDSDCDGICDSLIWGRAFGHTGTCTGSLCEGSSRACTDDSQCNDPLNYTHDSESQDPGFIHSGTETLHCYDDTAGRMSIVGPDLFYCDNTGRKRRVKHGYEASTTTSSRDCFLASGHFATVVNSAGNFTNSYVPVMGGREITGQWIALGYHPQQTVPLTHTISVDSMSCRATNDVANASTWLVLLAETTTDNCDADTSADGAQNDCWLSGNTFTTVCTITGTTGTSDYACAGAPADIYWFTAGDLVYVKATGPATNALNMACSWRVCFR